MSDPAPDSTDSGATGVDKKKLKVKKQKLNEEGVLVDVDDDETAGPEDAAAEETDLQQQEESPTQSAAAESEPEPAAESEPEPVAEAVPEPEPETDAPEPMTEPESPAPEPEPEPEPAAPAPMPEPEPEPEPAAPEPLPIPEPEPAEAELIRLVSTSPEPEVVQEESRKASTESKGESKKLSSGSQKKSSATSADKPSTGIRTASRTSQGSRKLSDPQNDQTRKLSGESQKGRSSSGAQKPPSIVPDAQNRKASSESQKGRTSAGSQKKLSGATGEERKVSQESKKMSTDSKKESQGSPQQAKVSELRKSVTMTEPRSSEQPTQAFYEGIRASELKPEGARQSADTEQKKPSSAPEAEVLRQSQTTPTEEEQRASRMESSDMRGVAHQVNDVIKDAERIASGPIQSQSLGGVEETNVRTSEQKQSQAQSVEPQAPKHSTRESTTQSEPGASWSTSMHETRQSGPARPSAAAATQASSSPEHATATPGVCTALFEYAQFLDLLVENPCTNVCDIPSTWKDKDTVAAAAGTFRTSGGSQAVRKKSCGHLPFYEWKIVKSALGYPEVPSQTPSNYISSSIAEVNEEQEREQSQEMEGTVRFSNGTKISGASNDQNQKFSNANEPKLSTLSSDVPKNSVPIPETPGEFRNVIDSVAVTKERGRDSNTDEPRASGAATEPGEQIIVVVQQKPCKEGKDCLSLDPIELDPLNLPPIELPPIVLTPLGQLDNEDKKRPSK